MVAAAYRIHPFWFWNGRMDDAEIIRQIAEMDRQGVGGFFICARQGLTVPYLSGEWFRKVRLAVEEAARHRMEVWLYDEYPYPSGMAGGEVILEHPDARHRLLEHAVFEVQGGETCSKELPWARILSAKAVPVHPSTGERLWDEAVDVAGRIGNLQTEPVFQKAGLTAYNQKRFFTYRTAKQICWTAPPGRWEIHVFLEKELDDFKYYGSFLDPCHPGAVETFIRLTHERYAREIGEYFGTTVKGIFTDETAFLGRRPWTPQLVEHIRRTRGYDITEVLGPLFCGGTPDAARLRYDYFQGLHELLRERYHRPIHDWCERHGLQYVAEVPSMRMTTQVYSHVPGGDTAHEKLGRTLDWILEEYGPLKFRANAKMVSSLARQLGRERALIECFHSVGWSMTLQDAKWMIDRLAALGINFFNFHAFFYTLDGMRKHDAPPSQFLQNPYWRHFRKLADYTARLSEWISQGEAQAEIALLDPTTTLWTHMGNPLHAFAYIGVSDAEKERLERLKRHWSELYKALLKNRRDFDHLDPELLAEAEVRDGLIRLGRAAYRVLILPPLSNLERRAWDNIRAFVEQGGVLIANGLLPDEDLGGQGADPDEVRQVLGLNGVQNGDYWQMDGQAGGVVVGRDHVYFLQGDPDPESRALMDLLDRHAPSAVRLVIENDPRTVLMQQRLMPGGAYGVFASHQEDGALQACLVADAGLLMEKLGGTGGGHAVVCCLVDPETGEKVPLAAERNEHGWRVSLSFAPYASCWVEISLQRDSESGHLSGAGGIKEDAGVKETDSGADSRNRTEAEVGSSGEFVRPPGDSHPGNPFHSAEHAGHPASISAPLCLKWTVDAREMWELAPERDNFVRFDHFAWQVNGEAVPGTVMAKTFIDQCTDAGAVLPVDYSQVFGTPVRIRPHYPVVCMYTARFHVETLPPVCRLLLDENAISGGHGIAVNGRLLRAADFRPEEVYDHRNMVCDITPLLKAGENRLTVEVTVEHDWDGVTDALFLTGPFGVRHNARLEPVITAPDNRALLDSGPYPDYPYYAGTMTFRRTVRLDGIPKEDWFELAFLGWDPHFHDIAEVRVNGHSLGVRAWTPYLWKGKTRWLREGENLLEVLVTNTLSGLLEGKYFDYASHTLKDVRTIGMD